MRLEIQASSLALSKEEILEAITDEGMREIKKTNPAPFFQAFSIVQEGQSTPKVIGEGNKTIIWPRKVVEGIKSVIKKGLQFFVGHQNGTNDNSGRKSLGQVVGSIQKEIAGKLHNIVVGLFDNKEEAEKFDICSIECDGSFAEAGGTLIAEGITKLTGIALGNSNKERPGFPGAVRLGQLQAFDTSLEDKEKNKNTNPDGTYKEDTPMEIKYQDVVNAVREMNIKAGQLFKFDEIRKDTAYQDEFRKIDQTKIDFEALTEKSNTLEADNKQLNKDVGIVTAKENLEKSFPEGLTDLQKKFINKNFNPENMDDLSPEGMKKFVEGQQKEFSEMSDMFGKKDDKPSDPPNNDDTPSEEDPVKAVTDAIVNSN